MSITTKIINHSIAIFADFDPVKVETVRTKRGYDNGFEVDRVKVTLDWWDGDADGEPSGWNTDVDVRGWRLTKKGARHKGQELRENIYEIIECPEVIFKAAKVAYETALRQGNIPQELVLGGDGQPGTKPLDLLWRSVWRGGDVW